MFRTFNMGVGMLVVVDTSSIDAALSHDCESFYLGEIVPHRGVDLV
jgi:phosphoribosylaminoimidazole (AIR) synthetase